MQVLKITVGRLSENCYILVSSKKNAAIIDPGCNFTAIKEKIFKYYVMPQIVLITHGHWDHIGAVNELKKYYSHVKIYASSLDSEFFKDNEKNLSYMFKSANFSAVAVDTFVEDETVISLDELEIKVISTPGHTPGSVCYKIKGIIFSGDTLFNKNVGRTDLYGGSHEKLMNSIEKLKKLDGDTIVCPGHGVKTTIKAEIDTNPYLIDKK